MLVVLNNTKADGNTSIDCERGNMLERGDTAPSFSLPGAVDGTIERVSLSQYTGDGIVVLVFYPADFSPTCTDELCSLCELDLVDLQRDVTLLGISTDTAYSHRAFANQYNLAFPLLSDNDGSVAESYGVLATEGLEGHRRIAKRSVFVLDPDRRVRYTWVSDDPDVMPDIETLRSAIAAVTGDEGGLARYRTAYDRYRKGRGAFDRGLEALEDGDWLTATDEFSTAVAPLSGAAETFDAARRDAEDGRVREAAALANETVTERRNAAKWYARAADHYATGDDGVAAEYLEDARTAHNAARECGEPAAPDDLENR